MDTTQLLYAAVGAPIATAKHLGTRVDRLRSEVEKRSEGFTGSAGKQIELWADEGRQVVARMSDGKMVDELAAKVDFDQAREQVTKLRDQLEDMLATWRTSFRPVEEGAGRAGRTAATAVEEAAGEVEKAADRVEKTVEARSAATTTATKKNRTASKETAASKSGSGSKKAKSS